MRNNGSESSTNVDGLFGSYLEKLDEENLSLVFHEEGGKVSLHKTSGEESHLEIQTRLRIAEADAQARRERDQSREKHEQDHDGWDRWWNRIRRGTSLMVIGAVSAVALWAIIENPSKEQREFGVQAIIVILASAASYSFGQSAGKRNHRRNSAA